MRGRSVGVVKVGTRGRVRLVFLPRLRRRALPQKINPHLHLQHRTRRQSLRFHLHLHSQNEVKIERKGMERPLLLLAQRLALVPIRHRQTHHPTAHLSRLRILNSPRRATLPPLPHYYYKDQKRPRTCRCLSRVLVRHQAMVGWFLGPLHLHPCLEHHLRQYQGGRLRGREVWSMNE